MGLRLRLRVWYFRVYEKNTVWDLRRVLKLRGCKAPGSKTIRTAAEPQEFRVEVLGLRFK